MAGIRPKQPQLESLFVASAKHGFDADTIKEEIGSLLGSRSIPHKIEPKTDGRGSSSSFHICVDNAHKAATHEVLKRIVTADIRAAGARPNRPINSKILAIPPHELLAPLFSPDGTVRELYSPSEKTGVTGARTAALLVNMSEAPPNGTILIPTAGYNSEALAAALAGHSVTVGDISPWVITGKIKSQWYSGLPNPLEGHLKQRFEESLRKLHKRGLPLERLGNIRYVRWDARKLPIADHADFGAVIFRPSTR